MDSYLYQATLLIELGDTHKVLHVFASYSRRLHTSQSGLKEKDPRVGSLGVREAGGLRLAL